MQARCQAYTEDGALCGRRAVALDAQLEYFVCERHRSDSSQQTNDVYGIVIPSVALLYLAGILLVLSVELFAQPSHLARDLIISTPCLILGGAALALPRWRRYQQVQAVYKEIWGFNWSPKVDKFHGVVLVLCGSLYIVFGALLLLRAVLF